ncbi:PDZ domain-containing protein [Bizionia gelidisalsuginis]|uniref:PDZ domain-containing protein n=2 Tax=Bizionia TaxID=283785 RepID=A0A8H2QF87_9FLAO|nr:MULTISPECIES: trypsin-like peptidase domain-containing protein [Bizionia]TYB77398.1 PDZ domain-containing protein [Bizionia saleffrena]TYC17920.1 PDZ domain-containing protein [Bizionia gelidisalsuginis]
MKKVLTMVFVSVLGGAITLGAYKTFLEKDEITTVKNAPFTAAFTPVNYTDNNSNALAAAEDIDFTSAAERTVHAVVHVKNVTLETGQPTIEDLFMGRLPQRMQLGTGSGVIISPDGYIITNNHVIDGSEKLSVTLNNNKTLPAKIIGTDPKTDIALLKVETDENLPYITFGDSDHVKIGEWVLAVGNPFNLTSTVTAGIISAKSRDLSGQSKQSFIQTDAAVNPGNSGGALVNTLGELIGINTAITSQTGSYIGYSFAVPSNIARKVVEDIMEYGNVQNGILGVTGGALNSMVAEKLGVDETEGFYIDTIEEDSGAEAAGLQHGDIIKSIDQVKISKFSDLRGLLDTKRPNDVVVVTYLRNGITKQAGVTLLKNDTYTIPNIGVIKEAKPKDLRPYNVKEGVKIVKLNSQYADYFKRDGVTEGSIITAINNTQVNSIEDVQTIIKNRNPYQPLNIEIINSNGEKTRYGLR